MDRSSYVVTRSDSSSSDSSENDNQCDRFTSTGALVDRIKVWNEIRTFVNEKFRGYVPPSEKFDVADVRDLPLVRHFTQTDLELKDVECINEAIRLKETEGLRPLVLNLSDDKVAGGCIDLGSGAQEESLWRRTALFVTQLQSFYPLGVQAIYSPNVPVLRGSEQEGFRWYDVPKTLDFIACPALRFPQWIITKEFPNGCLKPKDQRELAERLRLILRIAAMKEHDAVVLGAMGCGAWGNPPESVAHVFASVIPEFDGVFKKIVIAILNTHGPSGRTMRAFEKVFAETFGE